MGISVGDLLSMDFFKDFHVIAGHKGLNREIQGVSFLEGAGRPSLEYWKRAYFHVRLYFC